MSGREVSLSCTTLASLNGISTSNTYNSTKNDNQKVEVRWLQTEADSYLIQWQRRYRQIEGIDAPRLWPRNQMWEHYEDWYLTTRSILDIDVHCMNSKDHHKFNLENFNRSLDFFFNRDKSSFVIDFDDDIENDFALDNQPLLLKLPLELNTNIQCSQEVIAALRAHNLTIKDGKFIEMSGKKSKNADKKKVFKTQSTDSQYKSTGELTEPFSTKCSGKSARKVNVSVSGNESGNSQTDGSSKLFKMRPCSNRRQLYICEYPNCNYQSDRNFNFLRHKRTHGKCKSDELKRLSNGLPIVKMQPPLISVTTQTSDGLPVATSTSVNVPADVCFTPPLDTALVRIRAQSPPLSKQFNFTSTRTDDSLTLKETSPENTFSLPDDDYLDRQSYLLKDNMDHLLSESSFSSNLLEQSFLS